jgi:hypothetical protein
MTLKVLTVQLDADSRAKIAVIYRGCATHSAKLAKASSRARENGLNGQGVLSKATSELRRLPQISGHNA